VSLANVTVWGPTLITDGLETILIESSKGPMTGLYAIVACGSVRLVVEGKWLLVRRLAVNINEK